MRNAKRGLVLAMTTVSAVGCSGSTATDENTLGPGPSEGMTFPLVEPGDPVAPIAACEGVLQRGSTVGFENLRRTITGYLCTRDFGEDPQLVWTDDATGEIVDPEALARLDVEFFHVVHNAVDGGLREKIETMPGDEFVEVEVWFAIDESDMPPKDELIESEELRVEMERRLADRMREGARHVSAHLNSLTSASPGIPAPEIVTRIDAEAALGAPRIIARVPAGLVRSIGVDDRVVWIGERVKPEPMDHFDAYFKTDVGQVLDDAGWDGSGQTVAIHEWGYPNSFVHLPNVPAGNCQGFFGLMRKCHCPTGPADQHSRQVTGVVASSSTNGPDMGADQVGGVADAATLIIANFSPTCANPDERTASINWAVAENASVISNSQGTPPANPGPQDADDRYFDYVASHWPYPLIVTGTGNGGTALVTGNALYNGIVVGGSDHGSSSTFPGDRAKEAFWTSTQSKNWAPTGTTAARGWETPHIVAPAVDIATAGVWLEGSHDPERRNTGVSLAIPQISGIAASIHEGNSLMKTRPEALLAGLLASANENTDEAQNGTWPLNVTDLIDDHDGAGLVNAWGAGIVLDGSSKKNGGNVASQFGHDYGSMHPLNTPASTDYFEVWNASVPAGATLRGAAVLVAKPSCASPPKWGNCSTSTYPNFFLRIYEGGVLRSTSWNANQNYQLAFLKNTSGSTKTYTFKIHIVGWGGITGWNAYAMAWTI